MQELKKRAAENDRLEKEKQAKIFKAAVASKNVNVIADYIKENYDQQYFDESAYNCLLKQQCSVKRIACNFKSLCSW